MPAREYQAKRAAKLSNPITTAVVFPQADNSAYAAFVRVPIPAEGTNLSSLRFRLRARGRVTTGGAYTFIVKFQYNSDVSTPGQWAGALTITNNTDFLTLTSQTVSTATRSWFLDADCVWDSTSGRLAGIGSGLNSETVGPAFTTITAVAGTDFSTGKAGFVVNAIIGTTNAANFAYLDEFTVEVG